MTAIGVPVYEYGVGEAPIEMVTCFVDRAEITRRLEVDAKDLAVDTEFKVSVLGFPSTVLKDSVRVRCQGASIQEVTFAETEAKEDSADSENATTEIQKKKKSILSQISRLEAKMHRHEERRKLVMTYAEHMVSTRCQGLAPPVVSLLANSVIENNGDVLTQVLSSTEKETEDADEKMISLRQEIDTQKEALAQVEDNILRLKREGRYTGGSAIRGGKTSRLVRVASVGLQLEKLLLDDQAIMTPRVLHLTYLVSRASWKPSYDLRVDRGVKDSMELTYYGVVTNATGEDWPEVQLILSTASPSTGSVPPLPPTLEAKWGTAKYRCNTLMKQKKQHVPILQQQQLQMQSNMVMPVQALMSAQMEAEENDDSSDNDSVVMDEPVEEDGEDDDEEKTEKKIPVSAVSKFEIPRLATIQSDSKEHKVQVARLDALEPIFRHFCTPHLEQRAYLQARATNTSNFVLLPSDRAAVFADGAFVANTRLKRVAPGDQLDVFLGIDEDVTVEYRCLKNTTKTGEKIGIFGSKEAKTSRLVKEYVTTIHNTKTNTPVSLTLVQLLPRSTDETICVHLIQPESAPESTTLSSAAALTTAPTTGAVRNKFTNNVVISSHLPAKAKENFHFEYHVTWPFESGTVVVERS